MEGFINFLIGKNPLIDNKGQNIEQEQFKNEVQTDVINKINAKIKSNGTHLVMFEGFTNGETGETIGSKILTEDEVLKINDRIKTIAWSFSNVLKPEETNNVKKIKNAAMASTVILRKKTQRQSVPPNQDNNTAIQNLQKQIKCIECSIKKLELNLKLTNEDGINDDDFLNLLNEISELCGNDNGEKEECETNLQEFVDEVILKRDMNSISGLIKLASFMCPILAFANKSLFSELAATAETVAPDNIDKNTVGICSKIIGYITRSGNENILEEFKEKLELIDGAHNNGVIEGIVGFVGIGGVNKTTEDKIAKSMTSIVRRTVKNTIEAALKTATFYQKFICMVFITLLSTHIYLTLCKNDNNMTKTEKLYESYVEFVYNNMTNTTMKIGFENLTGGKKASKSRRAAKPRATRAANAAKAIAKVAAAKPKPKAAKAAPKKNK
jgi:hypothetical protein